jgi:Uma2 family endonuclease
MLTIVTPEKIHLSPGTVLRSPGTWEDYQILLENRHKSLPRIKYRQGEILLMSPLPQHGRQAHIIAIIITILLDYLGQNYEAFTPMTMDLPKVSGIEPDYSFYIDNWQFAVGKNRINWSIEPPPDLVLEVDVTSYTDVNDYLPYQVSEVWIYKQNQLMIYGLTNNSYILVSSSRYFPQINLQSIVKEFLEMARDRPSSSAMQLLRKRFPPSQDF